MAGSSLLALIDDIATLLDDVAALSKVAARKTAGVLGDDLALNAQQVSGVTADRELPVVWAVFKGSAINKSILVPAALAIGYFAPWAVSPLLMLGGLFLCYEGVEKLAHGWTQRTSHDQSRDGSASASASGSVSGAVSRSVSGSVITSHDEPAGGDSRSNAEPVDVAAFEKDKVKGAVRTDFILSAEIIAITLGTVAEAPLVTQVAVMVAVAAVMTVGVYGFVAGIVKLDDAGLWLSRRGGWQAALGRLLLAAAPWLMKLLSVVGTLAMFLVGGGILTHGVPAVHHWIENVAGSLGSSFALSSDSSPAALLADIAAAALPTLADLVVGVVAGSITLAVVMLVRRVR